MGTALVDDLLREVRDDQVEPERYSRLSISARCAPLALTTMLAGIAIFGGMVLGSTPPRHTGITPKHAD